MPRIVPRQIVTAIGQLFPQIHAGGDFNLWQANRPEVLTLLDLIEHMSPELMPLDPDDFLQLMISINYLRGALAHWTTRDTAFGRASGGDRTVIYDIYDILARCPDAAPALTTTELSFIPDSEIEFREGLRLDISTANQALANGEWKAATVLAGSVVEAFLLWAVQQHTETEYKSALNAVIEKKRCRRPHQASPEYWNLDHYIFVALELHRLNAETATLAGLAKDFRNFIHPGKAQRLRQVCDRGTALAALAAVERVVRCLTICPRPGMPPP